MSICYFYVFLCCSNSLVGQLQLAVVALRILVSSISSFLFLLQRKWIRVL